MSSESILGVQVSRRPAATPRARERRGAACVYSWVGSELARLPLVKSSKLLSLLPVAGSKLVALLREVRRALLPNDGKADDQHVLGAAGLRPINLLWRLWACCLF